MTKVCALWVAKNREDGEVKKDKNGNSYFTGTLELNQGQKFSVIAFLNRPKEKDTQPDIQVYLKDDEHSVKPARPTPDEFDGDGIPF